MTYRIFATKIDKWFENNSGACVGLVMIGSLSFVVLMLVLKS